MGDLGPTYSSSRRYWPTLQSRCASHHANKSHSAGVTEQRGGSSHKCHGPAGCMLCEYEARKIRRPPVGRTSAEVPTGSQNQARRHKAGNISSITHRRQFVCVQERTAIYGINPECFISSSMLTAQELCRFQSGEANTEVIFTHHNGHGTTISAATFTLFDSD